MNKYNLSYITNFILSRRKLYIVFTIITGVIYISALYFSGANIYNQMIIFGIMIIYVLIPGFIINKIFRIDDETLSAGIVFGFITGLSLLIISYIISVSLKNIVILEASAPVLIFLYSIFYLAKNKKIQCSNVLTFKIKNYHFALLSIFSLLLLAYTSGYVFNYPKASILHHVEYDFDDLWHIGNANAFKINFPPFDIHFSGLEFRYHFLYDMILGIFSMISGIPAFDIKHYYFQPILFLLLIIMINSIGKLYFQDTKKRIIFIISFLFINGIGFYLFGCSSLVNGSFPYMILNNSNSMTLTLMLMISFFLLFLSAVRDPSRLNLRLFILILLSFILLTLSKGSAGIMVLAVIVVTSSIMILRKKSIFKYFMLSLSLIIAFSILYYTLFLYGKSALFFSPGGVINGSIVETFIKCFTHMFNVDISDSLFKYIIFIVFIPIHFLLFLPFQSGLYIANTIADIKRFTKLSAEDLLLNGLALSGIILSYFTFHPYGGSHHYFIMLSSVFITILAVKYFYENKDNFKKFTSLWLITAAILALISTLTVFGSLGKNGLSTILDVLDIRKRPVTEFLVTEYDEQAMNWLKNNSNKNDIFATNRLYRADNDPRFFYYTAISERQAFIEGYAYLYPSIGNVANAQIGNIVQDRLNINRELFSTSDLDSLSILTKKYNISFLVVSKRFKHVLINDLKPVYENRDVIIYKISGMN